jgi:hypothetical protein
MDTTVQEKIMLLSIEEKTELKKNAKITVIFLLFFYVLISYMIFYVFPPDFIAKYLVFAFFILVSGSIGVMSVLSSFAKEKIVSTGYITNKRIHSSRRLNNSNRSTTYYITFGSEERSVLEQHYYIVAEGDYVAIHETRNNRSIIKIEILDPAFHDDEKVEIYSGHHRNIYAKPVSETLTEDNKNVIKRRLLSIISYRVVLMSVVCYIIYYTLLIITLFTISFTTEQREYIIIACAGIAIFIYLWLNRKTYFIFKDWRNGTKFIETKKIKELIKKDNVFGSNNKISIETQIVEQIYYFRTADEAIYAVKTESIAKPKVNDYVFIHFLPNSKICVDVKIKK